MSALVFGQLRSYVVCVRYRASGQVGASVAAKGVVSASGCLASLFATQTI